MGGGGMTRRSRLGRVDVISKHQVRLDCGLSGSAGRCSPNELAYWVSEMHVRHVTSKRQTEFVIVWLHFSFQQARKKYSLYVVEGDVMYKPRLSNQHLTMYLTLATLGRKLSACDLHLKTPMPTPRKIESRESNRCRRINSHWPMKRM